MDFIQIETGKIIHYDYDLSRSGIHVKVLVDLTDEEKDFFLKSICGQRDVVSVYYKDNEYRKGLWAK